MSHVPPPIALTMGEPAGISGELALKAWAKRRDGDPVFFAIDHPERLVSISHRFGLGVQAVAIADPREAAGVIGRALPVLPLPEIAESEPVLGRPSPATAPATIAAIDRAVALARAGTVAAVVTAPIHKETMQAGGFGFPGHTEYLGHLSGGVDAVMMLTAESAAPPLRVVPVTVHMALAAAAAALSTARIVATARTAADALRQDFGIARPRLAVAALNPHAGESGHMGDDEKRVIAPAITALRAAGIDATGPHPADSLFHAGARAKYDAVICMYHDQALIPLKTVSFTEGVNVTLGLPFVRTSPDHGTALGIAPLGQADPTSTIAALALAARIAARRAARQ